MPDATAGVPRFVLEHVSSDFLVRFDTWTGETWTYAFNDDKGWVKIAESSAPSDTQAQPDELTKAGDEITDAHMRAGMDAIRRAPSPYNRW
jgi:hypothetical protein